MTSRSISERDNASNENNYSCVVKIRADTRETKKTGGRYLPSVQICSTGPREGMAAALRPINAGAAPALARGIERAYRQVVLGTTEAG
ncbi:MAG: hypothetical protein J1F23_04950 [Oscillospiraceae bacterium]|nr:hypothetical protein [Oscillospiraceae bacterium]